MSIFYADDKHAIDVEVVQGIIAQIKATLHHKQRCVLAIAGGRSIESILDLLAQEDINWQKVHLFAVDDRCVPIDHEDSNSGLLKAHLADKVAVNFHPFIYKPDQEDRGAGEYTAELDKLGGTFDILVLSSGEDGHTAGLFPNHESFEGESEGYIFFDNSPKDPPERISATKNTLLRSEAAFILFVGEGKQQAYENFTDQNVELISCPSKLVQRLPQNNVYTDRL